MTWQWSPGGVLTLVAAVGFVLLAAVVWRRRADERFDSSAAWLMLVLLATGAWAAAYSLELASSASSDRQAWGDLKYVGICALPPAWVAFVATYTGRTWLRRRVLLLLAVEPLLVLLLLVNEGTHDLIRVYPSGSSRVAGTGVLFWPHSVYTYLVLWAATAMLVVRLGRMSPIYRRQSTVLVASLAVPFVCNLLFNAGVAPFDTVDLTPFAFLGSGVVLVWGVMRFRLVGARPVARSQAFTVTDDLVVTLDPEHRVIDLNPAAVASFGLPADRLVGLPVGTLLPHAEEAIGLVGTDQPVEERVAGRIYELHASPLIDRRSRRLGTLLSAHDVTGRKDVEQRLAHQALHDPLTGVANRTLYFDRLTHALDHASRTRLPVAVLFVDLDSFKKVNDELGHAAGNDVLVAVARRLRASVRKGDTIARMGGDEFAVLLEDVTDESHPAEVAEHIRRSLRRPVLTSGKRLTVTASVGVATGCDLAADEIVRLADEAMYAQKKQRS
ncbi:MAG: histidine kinase N-terminal 7TM domain-containing protein [Mycobacteriales bacterium]